MGVETMTGDAKRVLVADDEGEVALLIGEELSRQGFDCHCVSDPVEAMELVRSENYDLLIADIVMPRVTGLDLLMAAKEGGPGCEVILTTGKTNRRRLAQALMLGAYDYVEKPFDMAELVEAARRATSGRQAPPELPLRAARAMELAEKTTRAALEVVSALVRAVEAKDAYTRRHSEHVAYYAGCLAEVLAAAPADRESLRIASLLHDIGKIGVPDHILNKPGRLTDAELQIVRRHPELGAEILSSIGALDDEAAVVRQHHEDWDGGGYPAGLAGEDIHWAARVIRVADSIDAMLMNRAYKDAYPVDRMLGELRCGAGHQFDPEIAGVAVAWCIEHSSELFLPGRLAEAVA